MVRGFELLDRQLGLPPPTTPLWNIADVRFAHRYDWPLELTLERDSNRLELVFCDVVSFRAQSESEILAHWHARAEERIDIGTLYRINASTYLDEFAASTAAFAQQPFVHYLVAGLDLCVEVLAIALPKVVRKGERPRRRIECS